MRASLEGHGTSTYALYGDNGIPRQRPPRQNNFESLIVTSCLNLGAFPFCEQTRHQSTIANENWFFNRMSCKNQAPIFKLVDYLPKVLHLTRLQKIKTEWGLGCYPLVFWRKVIPIQKKSVFCNFELSNLLEIEVQKHTDIGALEVRHRIPWMLSEAQVHLNREERVNEHAQEVPKIPILESLECERQFVDFIAKPVSDSAIMQIGIFNTVAKLLPAKHDLRFYTGMFAESMIDLFEAGMITDRKRNLWPAKFIFTFTVEMERIYSWQENNPCVLEIWDRHINDTFEVRRNDNMVTINTVLRVDLIGYVYS